MKKLIVLLTLACAGVVFAKTGTWTGAGETGDWADAANWKGGVIPGVISSGGQTGGQTGDTAVFGPVEAGAQTTVDASSLTSIKSIRFEGAETPAYTFSGAVTVESAAAAADRSIFVDASVASDITFATSLKELNKSDTARLEHNGEGVLRLANINATSDGNWSFATLGTGDFQFDSTGGNYGPNFSFGHTGKTIFAGAAKNSIVPKTYAFATMAGERQIVIPEGKFGFRIQDGGSNEKTAAFFACDARITGGGNYVVAKQSGTYLHMLKVEAGKTVTIETPIQSVSSGQFYVSGGSGTVVLAADNTFSGMLKIQSGATVRFSKETNLGSGNAICFGADGSGTTLEYAGGTLQLDRAITSDTAGTACIRNAGTGALTLTGGFTQTAASALALDAKTSDIVFEGATVASPTLDVVVSGGAAVTFGAVQYYTGKTTVSGMLVLPGFDYIASSSGLELDGGTLQLEDASPAEIPSVTCIGGQNVIETADDLTLDALTVEDGALVNILIPTANTLKILGRSAGLLPLSIRMNGEAVRVDENGVVSTLTKSWADAVGGDWTDGNKWNPAGVPTTDDPVKITEEGDSYVVQANCNALQFLTLDVANAAEGETATLALGGEVTVTDVPVTVGQGGVLLVSNKLTIVKSVEDINRFTVEEGGKVVVRDPAEGQSAEMILSRASGLTDWNLAGGEVVFSNTAAFKPMSTGTVQFNLGSGAMTFADQSVMYPNDAVSGSNPIISVTPNAAGETSTLTLANDFSDKSVARRHYLGSGALYVGDCVGGMGVLNCSGRTSSSYFQNAPHLLNVGFRKGAGEMNLSSGTIEMGRYGVMIGSGVMLGNPFTSSEGVDPCCATGVVRVSGGSLSGHGQGNCLQSGVFGFCVGYGAWINVGKYGYGDFWYGRLELSGGSVDSGTAGSAGDFVIGAGQGEGDVVQTGGALSHSGVLNYSSKTYQQPFVIGLFGGEGRYVISNGTASVQNRMFVGGATAADLDHGASPLNIRTCTGRHDAKGLFALRGGTVAIGTEDVNRDLIVGADGSGEIEVGAAGAMTVAGDFVLSNKTASVLRVAPGADGKSLGKITAKRLVITGGAKLVIDGRDLEDGIRGWRCAVEADEVVGSFGDRIEMVNVPEESKDKFEVAYERNGRKGVWVRGESKGLMLILR